MSKRKFKYFTLTSNVELAVDFYGKPTAQEQRTLESKWVTATKLTSELDDALCELYRGLSYTEVHAVYTELDKSDREKPRLSMTFKIYGERPQTAEEKERWKAEQEEEVDLQVTRDMQELREIKERNPELLAQVLNEG
tara:strand:+ start:261943 stop:262356 length:414 start_codon:yes stop_codon:yes gene_type:complete